MSATISQELYFFLQSILSGIFIVFLYDFLRILRRIIGHAAWVIAVEDSIYWIFCALAVFIMIYRVNDGAIRGYSILGIGLGLVLYSCTVSSLFVSSLSFILNKVLKVVGKILYILSTPLRFSARKAGKGKNFLIKRLKKIGKEVKITLCKR